MLHSMLRNAQLSRDPLQVNLTVEGLSVFLNAVAVTDPAVCVSAGLAGTKTFSPKKKERKKEKATFHKATLIL